jgi:ectonucleotide pyrophosphatase/phosphodiesterase family protein 5
MAQPGNHGYNNSLPSMHPIFVAHGPAFKKNFTARPFNTVDIYSLICHIINIDPLPNDGSLDNVKHVLADDDDDDFPHINITCKWCLCNN